MSEVEALQSCLAAEHAACYGYGVVGGVLAAAAGPGAAADREATARYYAEHRAERDHLTELIDELGADPVAAEPAYETPFPVRSVDACRRLARLLETRCGAVYASAVAETADETRGSTADQLAACAIRSLTWGSEPVAFPGVSTLPS